MKKYAARVSFVVTELAADEEEAKKTVVGVVKKWFPMYCRTMRVDGIQEYDNSKEYSEQGL